MTCLWKCYCYWYLYCDPGNRNRCDDLHLGGVVSDAGHFVDAAASNSDVDTWRYVFRTGTSALRFVTILKAFRKSRGKKSVPTVPEVAKMFPRV
jgi:hypothetical protein